MNASLVNRNSRTRAEDASYRFLRTQGWGDHSHAMTGWEHVYEPVGRAPFSGSIAELLLGPIQVAVEQVDSPMRYCGALRRNHIVFSSILPTEGSTVCSGRPLTANTVVKFPRDYSHTAYANGPIKFVTVAVEENALADYVYRQSGGLIAKAEVARSLFVADSAHVRCFQNEILSIFQQIGDDGALLDQQVWRAEKQRNLLRLLLELMEVAIDSPWQLPSASTRAYIVEKAIRYMQSNLTDPVLMDSIAGVVRVSPRTLRYSFEEVLGVSPRAYYATLRLNRVRQELVADGSTQSIQSIANEYGFWHLGRFAQYYREAFGELPSDTCRRMTTNA